MEGNFRTAVLIMETEFLLSGEPALGFLMGLLLGMSVSAPSLLGLDVWLAPSSRQG